MSWEIHSLTTILAVATLNASVTAANSTFSYIIGAVIAVFIMVYLIYSLLRPDKF